MASFWDLLPTNGWPAGPIPSPNTQITPARVPASQMPFLTPSDQWASEDPPSFVGSRDTSPGSSMVQPTIVGFPSPNTNALGGILSRLFDPKPNSATSTADQPTNQFGRIPKNYPAEYRLQPPVSDWQRPETEVTLDSLQARKLIEKSMAAGLPTDRIVLNDGNARAIRDNARIADFFLPGSGNFVSGDWDNITASDIANLALSLATVIVPPGRAAPPARFALRVARTAEEIEAAITAARAASSIGPIRGNRVIAGERLVSFPEANRLILHEDAANMLRQLDARNRLLGIRNQPEWVPSLEDIRRFNDEIRAIRQQQGLIELEKHHEFVRQYGHWFRDRGIEPEDYISYMWAKYHRLAGGIHSPPNSWNGQWGGFIEGYRRAPPDDVHRQLYRMLRPWEQP